MTALPEEPPAASAAGADSPEAGPDSLTGQLQKLQNQSRQRVLEAVLLVSAVAATIATAIDVVLAPGSNEMPLNLGLFVIAWVSYALTRQGYSRLVLGVLVVALLVAAVASTELFGSVRTGTSALYVCAVVLAGALLPLRVMVAVLLAVLAVTGMLTWADLNGWLLGKPDFTPGLRVWNTQVSMLFIVACLLYYHRRITEQNMLAYLQDTESRLMAEDERDQGLEQFMHVFHTVPVPLLVQSGHTGSILDANPAFESAFGFARHEVLGRRDDFLWADAQVRHDHAQQMFAQGRVAGQRVQALTAHHEIITVLLTSEFITDGDDNLIISCAVPLLPDDPPLPPESAHV